MAAATGMAAGFSGWASGLAPFTDGADAAIAAVCVVGFGAAVASLRRPAHGPLRRLPAPGATATWRGALPWLAVAVVVVGVELLSYFLGGSRSLHPTVSSAVETLFDRRAVKATALLAWVAGGWYLVRR